MMHFKHPTILLTMFLLLIGNVSVAAAEPKNTPECKDFLLSEAERLEVQLKKTVQESGDKIESVFRPENFGGNKEQALMTKGAYMAFLRNISESLF